MEITEVRIKLADESQERLLAFCSITIDGCFVVRDLKIIQGLKGPFVAMPSRKLTDRCARCQSKNCLRTMYCGQCGARLPVRRGARCADGRSKLYADIAHPINSACRETIQSQVLEAFDHEQVLARQPGYVCRYDDFGCDEDLHDDEWTDASDVAGERSRRVEPAGAFEGPHVPPRIAADVVVRAPAGDGHDDFGAGVMASDSR